MTKNLVLENLDKPDVLEHAYRKNPNDFAQQLDAAIAQNSQSETIKVWHARLNYSPAVSVQKISIIQLIILCLLAGAATKIPMLVSIETDWFYPRYAPFIVISAVTLYFLLTPNTSKKIRQRLFGAMLFNAIYLAMLPDYVDSASVTMALIHLPLFSLTLLALSFMSDDWLSTKCRLDFIRFLGEMLIFTVLILLGGAVLTGLTLGLFQVIGLSIEQWYMKYIVELGLVSSPLVATYVFDSIQHRQSRFAPILSNVFSPLFLITVIGYLVATFYQGKSPFTDRNFLIVFNGLLVVILALTIFSISGKKHNATIQGSDYINVSLVTVTLAVNLIALSAILFRWAEYGITLNRLVVTGANILIFIHLSLILKQYVTHLKYRNSITSLERAITHYLPVYIIWSLIVSVILPLTYHYQ